VIHSILFGFILLVFATPFFVGAAGLVPCTDNCNLGDLLELIKRVIDFLLKSVAMPLAAIAFAWAGFLYLTAGGNPAKVSQAHDIFKGVVIGLLIALAAWLIVSAILKGLGVTGAFRLLTL